MMGGERPFALAYRHHLSYLLSLHARLQLALLGCVEAVLGVSMAKVAEDGVEGLLPIHLV